MNVGALEIYTIYIPWKYFFIELVQGGNIQDIMFSKPFKRTITVTKAFCPLESKVGGSAREKAYKASKLRFFFLFAFFMNAGPQVFFFLHGVLSDHMMKKYNCNLYSELLNV